MEDLLAVVTSDSPEEIRLYRADSGELLQRVKLSSKLVRMAFSPDGQSIVTTERDVSVRQYTVADGTEQWAFKIKPHPTAESYTSAVAYSPQGDAIAAGAPIGSNYDIRLLDAKSGQQVGRLSGHAWKPWTLDFTADGATLFSSGWDGSIRRWNVAERKQLPLPAGLRATAVVAASPDAQSVAYKDDSGMVHVIATGDGQQLRQLQIDGTSFSELAFSPDSRSLAGGGTSGDNVRVVVWDLADGKELHRWDWPKGRDPHSDVECLRFRPDGKQLAGAVFRQSAAYLWDLTSGRQVAQLKHPLVYGLSFCPDNATLATAGWDKAIRFWDTATPT